MNQKNINQKSYLILKNKEIVFVSSILCKYICDYNFVQYDFNQELINKSEQQRIISKSKLYMIKLILNLLDTKSGISCFT